MQKYELSSRRKLINLGVLVDEGGQYRFSQEYVFSSPSLAAGVVLGRRANGRIEWKTKDGKTLKEVQGDKLVDFLRKTYMYTFDEYKNLVSKYGSYSSWAIWDYEDESDTSIVDMNYYQLHSNFIFLALNISGPLGKKSWINFHGGKHDRKLKYACNDTKLRGSYITDLLKGIEEVRSVNLESCLTPKIIRDNVRFFNREMQDIKVGATTKFIILGAKSSVTAKLFNVYFRRYYQSNQVIHHYHHSYYGVTDKVWVNGLWKKVNICEDFSSVVSRYS